MGAKGCQCSHTTCLGLGRARAAAPHGRGSQLVFLWCSSVLTVGEGALWDRQGLNLVWPDQAERAARMLTLSLSSSSLVFALSSINRALDPWTTTARLGLSDALGTEGSSLIPDIPADGRCPTVRVCFQHKSRTMQNHAIGDVFAHLSPCSLLGGSPSHPRHGQPITREVLGQAKISSSQT